MEDKKYELVKEDTKTFVDGNAIYRIRALKDFGDVKAGDLGGYIEKEENLSQEGNCWVYDNARVFDNAKVYENAKVYGEAQVCDNVKIYGNAEIFEYGLVRGVTEVSDNAQIYGNALVRNDVKIYENTKIYGNSKISDNAQVYGNSEVYGSAKIYDNAQVSGSAKIYGDSKVYEDAKVYDYAEVSGNAEVYGSSLVAGYSQVYDNAKVYDNVIVCENAKIYGDSEVYGEAQIYGNTEVSANMKIFNTVNKKYEYVKETGDFLEIENSEKENRFQEFEEHCSKVVDKLKLQDELPNFQVISQKGLLYEKNNEDNNIIEIKNFYVDEVKKEMKENFLKIRNFKEERVKNGLDNETTVTKKDFEKHTFYKCTEEEVEQLNLEYKEEKDINVTDKEYTNKIYNQHYIEKYKPLSIIDEYPEIKAEVLERLPFDFGEVLPPFQVYNSNEMFYDSGTQEKSENLDNFMRSLVGDMDWDSMNIDNIMEWRKVSEDFPNVFNIIYFEKNNKGEFDDNSIKDFNSYDDYVDYSEKAIKEKLEDMLRHNPSLYKKIEENVIATQKEAGVYKEKTFEKEIKEKDDLVKEDKEIDFS